MEKVKYEVKRGRSPKKDINPADAHEKDDILNSVWQQGVGVALILALTLGVLNDFMDLVWWQGASVVGYALDITTMLLVLMMFIFLTDFTFITILILFSVFILELLPFISILPLWIPGSIILYYTAKKSNDQK